MQTKIFLATWISCKGSVSRGVRQRLLVSTAKSQHENSFNFRITGLIGSCKTVGSRVLVAKYNGLLKPTSLVTRGYLHGHWHRTPILMATPTLSLGFPMFKAVALTMKGRCYEDSHDVVSNNPGIIRGNPIRPWNFNVHNDLVRDGHPMSCITAFAAPPVALHASRLQICIT